MKAIATWVGIPLALFLIWAAVRTPSPEEVAKDRARDAISLCWETQSKKSLDPAAARFAAGACEMMESRFVETYKVKP